MKKDALILVRGGGDLATGTIHRLWSAGPACAGAGSGASGGDPAARFLCAAVYEKVRPPLKVCVRYGSKLWRRQKKSGNRMPFLFW